MLMKSLIVSLKFDDTSFHKRKYFHESSVSYLMNIHYSNGRWIVFPKFLAAKFYYKAANLILSSILNYENCI